MKASIIIRAYNAQDYIARSVKSALDQNFSKDGFEVLVVNDGSGDETANILDEFRNIDNFSIIDQENQGAEVAANNGIKASRGEYITFLDSDDEFSPDFLSELVAILDRDPQIDFCYPDYYEEFSGNKILVSPSNVFENIMIGVIFRKAKLQNVGLFKERVFFTEYDLFLRTINIWRGFHLQRPLFVYHRRSDSATSSLERIRRGLDQLEALHPDKIDYIKKIRSYAIS